MRPAIVLVSGAPGAGKTTLAEPLAAALGFALLSKDHIKETLHDAMPGPADDRPWSRKLGGASMELLWALAQRCPQVVLEANFRPHSSYERRRIEQLPGTLVEVHCNCPPAICAQRYARRAPQAHPVHVVRALSPDFLAEFDGPVGLGDVIEVDTTQPVDVPALATTVTHLLDTCAWSANREEPGRDDSPEPPGGQVDLDDVR
jgi:predicted kinase